MKNLFCLLFLVISISVFSQEEISIVSFKQSSSDIAARTNQRDDTKGIPCALVKVQFPMRNVLFEGDCLDYMENLPDASVDMVLCDLPYGTTQNPWASGS